MKEQIKGYDKLSDGAKKIFDKVYFCHQNAVGDKAAWAAIRVKVHRYHLEVHFENGEWLHYAPNGSWY